MIIIYHEELAKALRENSLSEKNTEKYKPFSISITKNVKRLDKFGEETTKGKS